MLPFGYFDLIETFPQTGCAICNLLQNDVQKLIDHLLWEHTNDPFILDKMRSSRGLCNEHGWQLIEMARALQIAVFYEAALDELLKVLDAIGVEPKLHNFMRRLVTQNGRSAADALEPVQPCLVCDLQNANEERYISIMAEHITNERLLQAYRTSDGLCLEHFKRVLRRTAHAERFIRIQKEIWTRLYAELTEFIHKLALLAPIDQFGVEAKSWRRTHAVFTGGKGIFGRRP